MMMSHVPMILTWSRIIAGPVIAALVVWAASLVFSDPWTAWLIYIVATLLFVLAALTDWLDGALARKLGTVSPLGAALDHGADKVLTACVLVALAYAALPADLTIAAFLIVGRDALLAALREGLAQAGKTLPVSKIGKWKTAVLLGAITALLADQAVILMRGADRLVDFLTVAGRVLLWAAAGLALCSAWAYLKPAGARAD